MRLLRIKNYEKYQTHRKKNPDWIKLHRTILTDQAFIKLSQSCRYVYLGLLILASESDNKIVNDVSYLAHRLAMPVSDIDLTPLFHSGLLCASRSTLQRMIGASETEKRREREETEERQIACADRVLEKRSCRLTDDEWVVNLKTNPAYAGINIDVELGKMDAWLSTRPQKKKTRRFIVNWLNRAEKPVEGCQGMDLRTQKQAEGIQAFLKRGTA